MDSGHVNLYKSALQDVHYKMLLTAREGTFTMCNNYNILEII